MPNFPQRDLTNQYISTSYQDVLQQYIPGGPTSYLLDGTGDSIFSIPAASVGGQLVTTDQASTLSVSASAWASHSLTSDLANVALIADQALSASYADFAVTATTSDTASWAINAINGGTQLITGSTYPITSSWAVNAINGGTQLITASTYPITSSWAVTASHAVSALSSSWASTSSFAIFQIVTITQSFVAIATLATQSLFSSQSVFATQSLFATQSISASTSDFASEAAHSITSDTASVVLGAPTIKSGRVSSSLFGDGASSLTSSVIFATPYSSDYSIALTSTDARIFTVDNKDFNGFVINSNSEVLFTGSVFWQTIQYGEFN